MFKTDIVISFFGLALFGLLQSSMALAIATGDREVLNRRLRSEATFGRTQRIEELVKLGADLNSQTEYGESALYYAIVFDRTKTALRLLELGANPNTLDESDRSPLHKAASQCNFRIVRALLKSGAKINHADFNGRTALINASESSCLRTVAVLLTHKKVRVHVAAQDFSLRSALDYARHPFIEQMLSETLTSQNQQCAACLPVITHGVH